MTDDAAKQAVVSLPLDISAEQYRTYIFADGFSYTVSAPLALYVKTKATGDSHRVLDASGLVHYIPAGWRVVRWCPKNKADPVQF